MKRWTLQKHIMYHFPAPAEQPNMMYKNFM